MATCFGPCFNFHLSRGCQIKDFLSKTGYISTVEKNASVYTFGQLGAELKQTGA